MKFGTTRLERFLSGYSLSVMMAVLISLTPITGLAQNFTQRNSAESDVVKAQQQLTKPLKNQALVESLAAGEDWHNRLYTPTYVTFLDNKWFIVDCWHNRIIWHTDIHAPIKDWHVMDDDIVHPHSIAFGDGVFAAEDTERGDARFYTFNRSLQTFERIGSVSLGGRPHRTVFDASTQSFLVLSSTTQKLHRIRVYQKPILERTYDLPFTDGFYTRSFSVVGKHLLFVSERQHVYDTTISSGQLQVLQTYQVPAEFASANMIVYTGKSFVMTATPGAIGVVRTLAELPTMQNQAASFGYSATPYYVSTYGDTVIVPEIGTKSAVHLFDLHEDGALTNRETLHNFGAPTQSSKVRQDTLWRTTPTYNPGS